MKKLVFFLLACLLLVGIASADNSVATHFSAVYPYGTSDTINSTAVTVLFYDTNGAILLATGTTVPTDGTCTVAKGAFFIDTDVATGTSGLYQNVGTSTSCNFDRVDAMGGLISTTVGTDAQVLISNATLYQAVTMSGDATISNSGALTIGNNKIGAAETNYTEETILIASGNASNTTTVTSGAVIVGWYPVDAIDNAGSIVNSVGISGTTLTLKTVNNVTADTTYKVVVLEP